MTRIRVLGEFAVEGESGTVDLPGGLPRQLVGYLALHRVRIPRRELADMLWPDGEEGSRPQRLRTALWETQRALAQAGAPALEPTRSTISLSPLVVVDLEEASRLLSAGAAEAALRLLEPGLSRELDQDWATPARRRARLLLVEALQRVAAEASDLQVALAYARRRVVLDPLSEPAHQQLIALLARVGDRASALAAYEAMRDRLDRDLGAGPSEESRRLLGRVAAGAEGVASGPNAPRPLLARPAYIPLARSIMVGRDEDMRRLEIALRADRLVTITGLGGMGKSRLALAYAHRLREREQPVTFVELAATTQPETCGYLIAAQLGVIAGPGRKVTEAIATFLESQPGLLVLDNSEHVRNGLGDVVGAVLSRCHETRILATSRERLAIPGERVVPLGPLQLPPLDADPAAILNSPAVQLLVDAAARRGASPAAVADVGALGTLARRLDGIPLALELSGGRLTTFEPAALANTLERGLGLLTVPGTTAGSPGAPEATGSDRHQSLTRAFDWSASTVLPADRRLLALLSTCPGRFPLTLVVAIADTADLGTDATASLARLVDADLVRAHHTTPWCYAILQPVRTYALEGMAPADQGAAHTALLRWTRAFSDDVSRMLEEDEAATCAELDLFFPLLREGVRIARERREIATERHIVVRLEPWSTWRQRVEVWDWLSALAQQPGTDADPEVLRMAAVVAFRQGRLPLMGELTQRCLEADPTGLHSLNARIMLAFAEHRWTDLCNLVDHDDVGSPFDKTITLFLKSTALVELQHPEAALVAAKAAYQHSATAGVATAQSLALLALARAANLLTNTPIKTPADTTPREMLNRARTLAASVEASELEAQVCLEQGRQELLDQNPRSAVEPLTHACVYWLTTGNLPAAHAAARRLAHAMRATGQQHTAEALTVLDHQNQLSLRTFKEALAHKAGTPVT